MASLKHSVRLGRRAFLVRSSRTAAALTAAGIAPGLASRAFASATSPKELPGIPNGVQTGEVTGTSGIVWSRTNRPSRMFVEYATRESFAGARRVRGPAALASGDFTSRVRLDGLPSGQRIFYRVAFEDLATGKRAAEPATGSFRTAPAREEDVSFVWSGDTAGQGWGINLEFGGMRCYETMRRNQPDFFIHCGDTIYADNPIPETMELPDGGTWKNVVIAEKAKVAETLAEFRGNFRYNLMDENVRRFNAEVPMIAQWDDHETVNNWYPGEMLLADDRYTVKSASLLAARANRAFHEYVPMDFTASRPGKIHRKIAYGPHLDVFVLDLRSFRGPNGANRQPVRGADTEFFGRAQLDWLKRELLATTATWKVIASDMPIGLIVYDNWREKNTFENGANGDGPVLGREHDFAELLRFVKHNAIRNVVWFTADVHYTAAHYYDPNKAVFQEFDPFWEFVSGPLNAGSFGPGDMDNTFGPQVVYQKSPDGRPNVPPTEGLQFFGRAHVEGATGVMTVELKDLDDRVLHRVELAPAAA